MVTVMANKGSAYMGTGSGKGDNRGLKAVKAALSSPLISQPIEGATGVIINIVADEQFPLFDAEAAAEYIQNSSNQDADVIFGLVYDPKLKEEVSVTVIATGYDSEYKIEAAELVERIPLRVADSMKYSANEKSFNKKATAQKYESEEIEVPHFMRK
jgi:cell division protein FtsZ